MAVAVCIETPTRFARRTIAAGAVIPIGTTMKLTTENTVVVSAANNDPFGGIAWMESTATDTFIELTVAMNGKWVVNTTGANVTVGNIVAIGGADAVRSAVEADTVLGDVVGKSLTTLVGAGTIVCAVGEST
jgi:hypothetical protein